MEKGTSDQSKNDQAAKRSEALEALFTQVTSRPVPTDEDRRRVRAALHGEWRAVMLKRRWRRGAVGLAAAAAALVVTILVKDATTGSPTAALQEMARVERVSGQVRVLADGSANAGAAVALGTPVYVGQSLRTGEGAGIALRFDSGMSLRVDQHSDLRLVDTDTVALDSGRVYVDTDPHPMQMVQAQPPGRAFQVVTARGVVRHLGTQFMVRMADSRLQVNVREGRVEFNAVDPEPEPLYVSIGQELSVNEHGVPLLAESDQGAEAWRWAEELGPEFVLDGRTMAEFLDWVAGETGTRVVYLTAEARSVAAETELHGKVDLPARQALDLVLETSDLSADIRDGVIEITLKR